MVEPSQHPAGSAPPLLARADLGWVALALLATAAVFWRSLGGELVYDDLLLIGRNPRITELANLPELFGRPYWDFLGPGDASQTGYWRPLTAAAQTVAWVLGGGSPWAFHALSLVMHLGATAAAYLLARGLTRRAWVAGLTALLFGLHPTHVESVAWISSLNDPLAGFFSLLGLVFFLRWRQAGSLGVPLLAALSFGLGLLAKEVAVAVIPLALAIDFGRRGSDETRVASPARAYAPLLVVLALYLLARMFVFGSVLAGFERTVTDFGVSISRLVLLRLELLGGFLKLSAWPLDLNLFRPFRPTVALTDPALLSAAVATLVAVAVLLFLAARRLRPELAAFLIVPAGLLPVLIRVESLGSFPLSDRFLYVPVFGFVLLVASLLSRWLPRAGATGILLVAAGLYAWKSHDRIGFWHDEEILFRTAAEQSPRSPYVQCGLGRVLLDRQGETGDTRYLEQAFAVYERAQDLLIEAKQPESDILATSRDYLQANLGLGWCYVYEAMHDEYGSPATAIAIFEQLALQVGELIDRKREARSLGVRVRDERLELELVYTALGTAQLLAGQLDEAERSLRKALVLAPNLPEAHQNLGRLHASRGDWAMAKHHFEKALAERRGDFEDKLLLAQTLKTMGENARAEELALELVAQDPRKPHSMTILATIRLEEARGREALVWIDRALEADPAHGHAWYLKAKALLALDANQQATIEAFRRATALMPDSFEANYDFGGYLQGSGASESAVPYLVRAYALVPDARLRLALQRTLTELEYDDARAPLELARIEKRRGELVLAEWWLDRALELEPELGPALYLKSQVLRHLERHDEAIELGRRACGVLTDDFVVWSELGFYLAERERFDEAADRLERSLALEPPAGWSAELVERAREAVQERLEEIRDPMDDADAIGPVLEREDEG